MTFKIQTLDEILAGLNPSTNPSTNLSTDPRTKQPTPPKKPTQKTTKQQPPQTKPKSNPKPKNSKPKPPIQKPLDYAFSENNSNTQTEILAALTNTERENLYNTDREHNYLRWLAFYYLSKRELSKYELKQKLIAKGFDDDTILPLLDEFAEKDYQSDYRFAMMTVREAIRTGKGKQAISQKFYKAKLNLTELGMTLDELIATAQENLTDGTDLEDEEDINWLKLAVETRTKKYGNTIPKDPKEKARQLRFLQYRGFEMGVCFDALKMTVEDF